MYSFKNIVNSNFLSSIVDDEGNMYFAGSYITSGKRLLYVLKLNKNLGFDTTFSTDGVIEIPENIAVGSEGVELSIDSKHNITAIVLGSTTDGWKPQVYEISSNGESYSKNSSYAITSNMGSHSAFFDIYYDSLNTKLIIGDRWYVDYDAKNQIVVKHSLSISDLKNINNLSELVTKTESNTSWRDLYAGSVQLSNKEFVIADRTQLIKYDYLTKSFSNLETNVSTINRVSENNFANFYTVGSSKVKSSEITDEYATKYTKTGTIDYSFGINGKLNLDPSIHIFKAFSNASNDLILLGSKNTQTIGPNNTVTNDFQVIFQRFDSKGVLVFQKELAIPDNESFGRRTQTTYDNIHNELILATSDSSFYDFSLVGQVFPTAYRITLNGELDNSFKTPTYNQTITRFNVDGHYFAADINGNAGATAKLLGAVFGKDSVYNKQYVGIGLSLLDAGMSTTTLASLAVDAANLKTNDQIVSTLWKNVFGTTASISDKSPYIKLLDDGMSPGTLAWLAADTTFNKVNINLVGLAQTGIEYIPV